MAEPRPDALRGRRLLVVEDEYLIAVSLARSLEGDGAEVVGPAGSVRDALALVEAEGDRLDGAVLDINLRDERVYPRANA
jgi:ActR/RegA family two-component response regulator